MPTPLAITMGEPSGIGGEILIKAWRNLANGDMRFFALDDPDRLRALAAKIGENLPIREIGHPQEAETVFTEALPVLPIPLAFDPRPGHPDPRNAPSVRQSIERAVFLTMAGQAGAVVTNPIQKKCLYDAGFTWPGHTEFLASLAPGNPRPVMMLACDAIRVVPVTIHVALEEAIRTLNRDEIVATSTITAASLRSDFGIAAPRLAVAALNPHAGEEGTMGKQETTIVGPAVDALRAKGIDAFGPLPPDTMFHEAARANYDVAICMYHDQALIPIKTLDFDGGVNVTLGLPFVRTSPDHGTALNIAGTGRANPRSLMSAIKMAWGMASRRAAPPASGASR